MLKKAISTSQQAINKIYAKEGDISSVFSWGVKNIGDKLVKYFNVAKNFVASDSQDCVAEYNDRYDSLGDNYDWNKSTGYYKFATTDCITYTIGTFNNNCKLDRGIYAYCPTLKTFGTFHVDINGKKVLIIGVGMFFFYR